MFSSLTFWQGALVGLILGFFLGFFVSSFFHKTKYTPDMVLAWILATVWLVWHVGAGFNVFGVTHEPPTVYDIVSGGAVGFILGEKFFDYVSVSVRNAFKRDKK